MHKVKGKEFVHVWIMHHGIHNQRVNYVACTRAKNSLHIHTNQNDFDGFLSANWVHFDDSKMLYDFVLTHKDIDLSRLKLKPYKLELMILFQGIGCKTKGLRNSRVIY